jgi:alpha-beta hydrolase superfamily lysophospholipase
LHLPEGASARDCVAVICAPVGHEFVHSYRSLVKLSDELAARGIPALRFDYHGTGDAPGSELDPGRLERWEEDIRAAAGFAKEATGRARVCLIGLRLGAALAAQSAARAEIDLLVLWEPIVSGNSYYREAKAVALTSAPVAGKSGPEGSLEAAGFIYTAETCEELKRLDLLAEPIRAKDGAFLLTRDDFEHRPALAERLKSLDIATETARFSGYMKLMAEPQFTEVPIGALRAIGDWLERKSSPGSWLPAAPTEAPILRFDSIEEQVCVMGESGPIIGVRTKSDDTAASHRPTLVFLNAGAIHHVGPHRLYVTLARLLARKGYDCVRLDFHGLGDTPALPGVRENHPYPDSATADAEQALRYLSEAHGLKRFIPVGLCSGAHAAFHVAADLAGAELADTILINPLTYRWVEGMSLEMSASALLQDVAYYKSTMRDPKRWLKVLKGQVKFGYAFKTFGELVLRKLKAALPAEPTSVEVDLKKILEQKRQLTLFIARQDPGYDLLLDGAGRLARTAQREGALKVTFIEDADHTFSRLAPREVLIASIMKHLGKTDVKSGDHG